MAPKTPSKNPPPKPGGVGAPPTAVTQSTPVAPPPSAPVPPPAAAPPTAAKPAAAAAPPKKKKASKMPGPKKDCPYRLLDQLKDYTIIAVMLGFIVMFGQMLQGGADHGEHGHGGGHGEEHGGEHHRELNGGHHHVDPTLDMQVTLGICVVLISVTIFFEVVKHHVEHNCPPMMAGILQAMFGELTVLGFIALFTYFCLKFGVIEYFSLLIYHDPEHLLHLFEDIHFMLFFVMLVFLGEAVILIFATLSSEETFMRTERLIASYPTLASYPDGAAAPAVAQLLATYKAAREHCCMRLCICPRLIWSYREAEAREELSYALIRSRFISPPNAKPGASALPADFDFSCYLRNRMAHEVAHSLHVSPMTWIAVIFLLSAILYLPVLEEQYYHLSLSVYSVVGLGWALWLYSASIRCKLGHIMYMLTPPHALLDGPPAAFDEEAPTAALLAAKTSAPPYELLAPTKSGSKQERLFWRGRAGPGHLLFLLRLQMLATAICLAVLYTWLTKNPHDVYMLLLGFLPVLDVMITSPKVILPSMVITTSIEMMSKQGPIKETLNEMRTEKTLKMLKMLQTLQAQAKRAQKLQAADKKKRPGAPPVKPKELDPAQEAELTQVFNLFDKDNSGTIDKEELKGVMLSLGVELDDTALAALYTQMDPDGSGTIDFKEFCDVMGDGASGPTETPAQMASSIFQMLDKDGSGKITAKELKDSVILCNPALTDDDIAAAMSLFDADGTGSITEKEFRQGLEKMGTFK